MTTSAWTGAVAITSYISEPVDIDRSSVRAEIENALIALKPGLELPAGSQIDFLVDVFASTSAQDRQLLTEVLAIIFRYSGEKIDRVPQVDATPATGVSTWVRTSADEIAVGARTVPAGTEVTVTGLDGEPVAFATAADFTFADGVLTTTAGAVALNAVVPGETGNGLQAGAQPALTTTWLASIALTAPTSGGADAEEDDTYLDRLSDTKPLQLNAIAKGEDLARWMRNQTGVLRALALDNYNAAPNVAGHITAVPVDENGDALSGPGMTALRDAAQEITLTNLIIHVVAPTYTTITVAFTGVARAGWDTADVEARAEAAVLAFLDRARWGSVEGGEVRLWVEEPTVYYQDISTVLNNVEGFWRHTSLTINGGTSDVVMSGPGALPASDSTAAGTVVAP